VLRLTSIWDVSMRFLADEQHGVALPLVPRLPNLVLEQEPGNDRSKRPRDLVRQARDVDDADVALISLISNELSGKVGQVRRAGSVCLQHDAQAGVGFEDSKLIQDGSMGLELGDRLLLPLARACRAPHYALFESDVAFEFREPEWKGQIAIE